MELDFGLLGPVRIRHRGVELPLGALKQRALLAALLLQPNRVVPMHRLTETLWDGRPPPSALANLRTYANRLRERIPSPPGGHDRIVTRHPGYLARVLPGELDTAVFGEHQQRGRAALRQGDAKTAVTELTSALDLWRGSAAEGIPRTMELGPRLAALDEQRHTVVEDLMRARLTLGDDTELIPELRGLAAESPTREGIWWSLMLALYRSGDTAAALAAYRDAYRALDRCLGVEPGTELALLHKRVLNRDPTLSWTAPASASVSARRPAPCTLPPEPTVFVGRTDELAELARALRPGGRPVLVAVHGPAGSGKSFLAAKAAADVAGHYPDGQLHVDLRGAAGRPSRELSEVLVTLLRGLGENAATRVSDPEELLRVFRETLAERRVLLLLDNAVDEAAVRPLVTTTGGSATLITCRRSFSALEGVRHLGLDPLSLSEAVGLLSSLCGADRVRAEPEAATRIARLCDRLPFPLWLSGSRLSARSEWSLAVFARLLSDERQRLDALCCGDLSFRAALDLCYLPLRDGDSPVDRQASALFRGLGLARERSFGVKLAADLLGGGATVATAALGRLADLRLIEPVGPGGYRLTGLLCAYAAERAEAEGASSLSITPSRRSSSTQPQYRESTL